MYQAVELTEEVKTKISEQWDSKADKFADTDMVDIAKDDTQSALNNQRYTDAVVNTENNEFVALIGVIKAERINCHKVLDLKLNPSSNPDYRDEQEIGMMVTAEGIVGSIVALAEKGIIENNMNQVKIFGRGHDMKTFFKLVEEWVSKNPIDNITVFNEAGWLVIQRN